MPPECSATRRGAGPRPAGAMLAAVLIVCGCLAGAAQAASPRTIVFFGDSLTAGYGLADPGAQSFPALIQAKIDAENLPWRVVNAGLSGETSAGGLRRVDWVLNQRIDVFVLELGANDGLRGVPPEVTRANLQAIMDHVRARHPGSVIVLAGMRMPGNMGPEFAQAFRSVFPDLAARNTLVLIPFLLEGVAGHPELNQADGIHPTPSGEVIVADTVWRYLRRILLKAS